MGMAPAAQQDIGVSARINLATQELSVNYASAEPSLPIRASPNHHLENKRIDHPPTATVWDKRYRRVRRVVEAVIPSATVRCPSGVAANRSECLGSSLTDGPWTVYSPSRTYRAVESELYHQLLDTRSGLYDESCNTSVVDDAGGDPANGSEMSYVGAWTSMGDNASRTSIAPKVMSPSIIISGPSHASPAMPSLSTTPMSALTYSSYPALSCSPQPRSNTSNNLEQHTAHSKERIHAAIERVKAYILDSRDRCKRQSRSARPINNDGDFKCTSGCDAIFKRKWDWVRHEEINQPQEFWICTVCPFSSAQVFHRSDKFLNHANSTHHGLIPAQMLHDAKVEYRINLPHLCGFCDARLPSWAYRCDHIAEHFRNGFTMDQWKNAPTGSGLAGADLDKESVVQTVSEAGDSFVTDSYLDDDCESLSSCEDAALVDAPDSSSASALGNQTMTLTLSDSLAPPSSSSVGRIHRRRRKRDQDDDGDGQQPSVKKSNSGIPENEWFACIFFRHSPTENPKCVEERFAHISQLQ
jgi:hypothetical protein